MNPRATIALLIVTLLAVGGLFYLRKIAPATRDAEELKRYAAVFDPEEIEEIDIVRGTETISLRRDKDAWQLTAPMTDRASPEQVDRLLTAVRFLNVRDRNDAPDEFWIKRIQIGAKAPSALGGCDGAQPLSIFVDDQGCKPVGAIERRGKRPVNDNDACQDGSEADEQKPPAPSEPYA